MSIQINYKNNGPKNPSANLVLFVDENFSIKGLNKYISNTISLNETLDYILKRNK